MSASNEQRRLRILVVEDHGDVAANLADFMALQGHTTDFATSGEEALARVLSAEFDVILLDIMLAGMDGLTFCRKLREDLGMTTPVLILSALDTVPDKIAGFRAGTDDYLTKPYALEEVEVRVEALARRAQGNLPSRLAIGDLELDVGRHRVTRAGRELSLSQSCFTLLVELMRASPEVVPRGRLEWALWGDEPPDSDALRSQVYLLRRAIDKPFDRPLLETVHGVGYRLAEP